MPKDNTSGKTDMIIGVVAIVFGVISFLLSEGRPMGYIIAALAIVAGIVNLLRGVRKKKAEDTLNGHQQQS